MEAMVCPIKYPIPAPGPITAGPAAMPTPIMVTSPLACSNASVGITSANTSIPAPFASRLTLSTYFCLLLVVPEHRQFDVNLREYSEYVSLQNCHEDLEPIEHHGQGHRNYRHGRAEIEDEPEKHVDDEVPGQDVGVEPHPDRQGLGELAQDLDAPHERNHDRLERQSRGREALEVRSSPVAPEPLVLGEDERKQREHQRERDVRGDRIGIGNQPDQVQREDEHEERERVREPLLPLFPDLATEVAPEPGDLLYHDLISAEPILEQAASDEQRQERHGGPDPQEPDGLADGDVYGPDVQWHVPGMLGSLERVEDLFPQLILADLGQTYPQTFPL